MTRQPDPLADRPEALDKLDAAAIAARFALERGADGLAVHIDPTRPQQRTVLLEIGELIGWQRLPHGLRVDFLAGAPLALTWSADGCHAEAAHLGHPDGRLRPSADLNADVWHTAESLGHWSLICLTAESAWADFDIEAAAPDWFPRPPKGSAS